MKLFASGVVDGQGAPGTILAADDALRIAAGAGAVAVVDVQPAGKARMAAADWIRGRGARPGQRFA